MRKWKVKRPAGRDVFDMLGINPLMEYKVRFDTFIHDLGSFWQEEADMLAEFFNDVRIHDQPGTHTAQEGHRPSGRQSAEDRQGDSEGGGDGSGAERASASGDVGGVC